MLKRGYLFHDPEPKQISKYEVNWPDSSPPLKNIFQENSLNIK